MRTVHLHGDPRRHGRSLAGLARPAAHAARHASDQQRRRRLELRDARARASPTTPTTSPRCPAAILGTRRAGDGETMVTLDGVERRLHRRRPAHRRPRRPTHRHRRDHGRAEHRDRRHAPPTSSSRWRGSSRSPSPRPPGDSGCAPRRRPASRRASTPTASSGASRRFVELLGHGTVEQFADVAVSCRSTRPVRLRTARVNRLLGTELSHRRRAGRARADRLRLRAVAARRSSDDHDVRIPSWRPDCAVEVDLIEEVARHWGYDRIGACRAAHRALRPPHRAAADAAGRCARALVGPRAVRGDADGVPGAGRPGPCRARRRRHHHRQPAGGRRVGAPHLAAARPAQGSRPQPRSSPARRRALRDRPRVPASRPERRRAARRARAPGTGPCRSARRPPRWSGGGRWPSTSALDDRAARRAGRPGCTRRARAEVVRGGEVVGAVGEVDPGVLEAYGIDERVAWLEVDLGRVLDLPRVRASVPARSAACRRATSTWPSRCPTRSPAADVLAAITAAGGELLVVVLPFDVYRGAGVAEGGGAWRTACASRRAIARSPTPRSARPVGASSTPSSRPSRLACVADHPSRLRLGFARRIESGRSPLPEGTLAVGVGLLVSGITSYGFLVLAARALEPDAYAPLGLLWTTMFLLGPGLFLPVEQEVSRALAARSARGEGGGPVLRRAGLLAAGLLGVLVVVLTAAGPTLLDHLFDGQGLLLVGLALGLAGTAVGHLARGACSGQGRFRPYAVFLGADGVIRLGLCVVLAIVGVDSAGWYGIALGVAPGVAVVIALARERGLVTEGPEAGWGEVSRALLALLLGSILSFTLINGGPLAIELLGDRGGAGRRRALPQRPDHRPRAAVPVPGGAGVTAAEALGAGRRAAVRRVPHRPPQPALGHRRRGCTGHRGRLRGRAADRDHALRRGLRARPPHPRAARPGLRRSTWSPRRWRRP